MANLDKQWTLIDFVSCRECQEHKREHFNEMLECLLKATGIPKKDEIYKLSLKSINDICGIYGDRAKDVRRQVRHLINEHLVEAAQHVCQNKKQTSILKSIADELSILPQCLILNKEIGTASFDQLERFVDIYGKVELREYGRQAIQSSERDSLAILRGRNLYTQNEEKSTFEICLQIEYFNSNIYIGICSDNASPNDIEEASNAFPIDPLVKRRDGNIFHLIIDTDQYMICLSDDFRSKKWHNSEEKERKRTISRRRCPLPWRFFVKLTNKNNHVRIVYQYDGCLPYI